MTIERRLTVSESNFVLAGFGPVVVSTTCTGRVDPVLLDRAWHQLTHDHPVLRCVIRASEDGFALVLRDNGPEVAAGADGFLAAATTRLDGGAVSRLTLRQSADTAVLTLAVDHALSDARLVRTLLHTLLRHYTDLLRGDVAPSTPRPVFESTMEDRLLARYEPGWPQLPETPGPPAVLSGGTGTPSGFGVHNVTFDPGVTAEIVTLARENRISVNDLVCGAVCCAVRKRFPDTDGPLPVALCIPVDLRHRLDPPIAPDAQLCCALPCVVTVPVDVEDDPVEVGRRLGAQLRAAIDRAEPQRTLLALCLDPAPPPPMTFMVSNVGVVENPVLPEGMRVTGSHFAATLPGPVPGMFVATVGGRLTLDVVYDRAFQSAAEIGEVMASVAVTTRRVGAGLGRRDG